MITCKIGTQIPRPIRNIVSNFYEGNIDLTSDEHDHIITLVR